MNERDIFLAAIEINDKAQQLAYVEQACGQDSELKASVERLLEEHSSATKLSHTTGTLDEPESKHSLQTQLFETSDESQIDITPGEVEFRKYLEPSGRNGWLGRLAHYDIERIIGRGAFGIVAKAFDEKLHRVVAIKLMSPDLALTSPPRKRFIREARTAAAITHENVVTIYAVEEQPIPYLVMEFISGPTLQQWMDSHGPMDITDIVRIGRQIASGLAAAHASNLIHRDIKPSNILLTDAPNERVKITDFGLARAVDDASLTTSGVIAGTPLYMSPEQARGNLLDLRADLFSLGSVLYQMACGRPPFRASHTTAVLKRVCEDNPRPLSEVIDSIPTWLEAIINRLLQKNPDDRFQSAQEVAELFEKIAARLKNLEKIGELGFASTLLGAEGQSGSPHSNLETSDKTVNEANLKSSRSIENGKTSFDWRGAVIAVCICITGLVITEAQGITSIFKQQALLPGSNISSQPTETSPPFSRELLDNSKLEDAEMVSWLLEVSKKKSQKLAEAVRVKILELNPGMEDKFRWEIAQDEVVGFFIDDGVKVRDIRPLRALRQLKKFTLWTPGTGSLQDISPLLGLPLEELDLTGHEVEDISPLALCQLRFLGIAENPLLSLKPLENQHLVTLNIGSCPISDLSPLKGQPLEKLFIQQTPVADLSPLEDMPLTSLNASATKIRDLSPLRNSKLRDLAFNGSEVSDISPIAHLPLDILALNDKITNYQPLKSIPLTKIFLNINEESLKVLREIPTLRFINDRAVAEILQ